MSLGAATLARKYEQFVNNDPINNFFQTGWQKTIYTSVSKAFKGTSSKTKCNKRVALTERCRRSRSVARGCLHLSAREKTISNTNKKKGDPNILKHASAITA